MRMRLMLTILVTGLIIMACGQQEEQTNKAEQGTIAKEANEQKMSSDTTSAQWQLRLDYPSRKSKEDISITDTGKGYHIVSGPRAIYYKDGMRATGSYRFEATFTQNNNPGPEAYGLFVGGENLQADDQHYLYFLIRQDGKYLIKRRVGSETKMVVDWTGHDAVNSVQETDKPVNKLGIRARSDSLHFMVNDSKIDVIARDRLKYTDGQTGLRINHRLDLTVEDISLTSE